MKCLKCGTQNDKMLKTCPNCGSSMPKRDEALWRMTNEIMHWQVLYQELRYYLFFLEGVIYSGSFEYEKEGIRKSLSIFDNLESRFESTRKLLLTFLSYEDLSYFKDPLGLQETLN